MNMLIEEIKTPLLEHSKLRKEIIALAKRNTHHLNNSVFDESNPLFDYIATREEVRTELLLNRIGRLDDHKLHFLVVKDPEQKQLVAYAVLNPAFNNPNRVSLTAIVVHEKYRGRGISQRLINYIQQHFAEVTLTCFPSLVPLYEKFGFQVVNTANTLIAMEFGKNLPLPPSGIIAIDDEYVMSHPKVLKSQREVRQRVGELAFKDGLARWQRDTDNAIKIANIFFEQNYSNR